MAGTKGKMKEGDIVKISTGPDFFKDIEDAMKATHIDKSSPRSASFYLHRLHLDKIPMITHEGRGLTKHSPFLKNAKGTVYEFKAGEIFGLPLYAGLKLEDNGRQGHWPHPSFYTQKSKFNKRMVSDKARLIEPLHFAASNSVKCLSVVAKVALIGNGAIEGHRFLLGRDEIGSLTRLIENSQAPHFGIQTTVAVPMQDQTPALPMQGHTPALVSTRDVFHLPDRSNKTPPARHEDFSHSTIANSSRSESGRTLVPSPTVFAKPDPRECSVASSTLQDEETQQFISDPSEFLSMDAAIREDEKSGRSEVQAAEAKLEKIAQHMEKLERSAARANNKKRIGQDKIRKAEHWRKDSTARLAPNLRAFWEATYQTGKLPDAS